MAFAVLRHVLITVISVYQRLLSPFLGNCCRFYPSCSEYAKISLKQDAHFLAVRKIAMRLLRCQPFHPGGIDFP